MSIENGFVVGALVYYVDTGTISDQYIGTILEKEDQDGFLCIRFKATGNSKDYPEGYDFGTGNWLAEHLSLVAPFTLSPADKIKIKTKKLWNNSKYVKKYPNQGLLS